MIGNVTQITREEFENACRLYTSKPTMGTGGTRTGGTGTNNAISIGIKDINTPIDDGVLDTDPIRFFKQFR